MLRKLCRLAVVLVCVLSAPLGHAKQLELRIATASGGRTTSAIAQRVLTEAYRQLKIKLEFVEMPSPRIVKELVDGYLDGLDNRVANTPLADLVKIDVPLSSDDMVAYTVKPLNDISNYQSLRHYKVGYIIGAKLFELRLQGMRVETAPNEESLFRMLEAGRTDVAVDSDSVYCVAKQMKLDDVSLHKPPLETILGYHWLSKRYEYLIPQVEAVLKKMEQAGIITQIQQSEMRKAKQRCG